MSDQGVTIPINVQLDQLRQLNIELQKAQQAASQGITIPVRFSQGQGPSISGSNQPSQSAQVHIGGLSRYAVRDALGRFSNQPEDVAGFQSRYSASFTYGREPGRGSGLYTSSGYKFDVPEDDRDMGFGDRAMHRAQRSQDEQQARSERERIRISDRSERDADNAYNKMVNEENRFSAQGYRYNKYKESVGPDKTLMSFGRFKEYEYEENIGNQQLRQQDVDEAKIQADQRQSAARVAKNQSDFRAKQLKAGVFDPADYGYSITPMTPAVSMFYAGKYEAYMKTDPTTPMGFQTFMGQQAPLTAQQAMAINMPTQQMSAAQLANIGKTAMYTPDQLAQAQQPYTDTPAGWISSAVGWRGFGPFSSMNYRQIQGVGRMGIEAAHIYDQYSQLENYRTMHQRPNIMGESRVTGETIGGGLGAALGYAFMGGPIGGYFGMTIGSTLGGAVGSRFGTEKEREQQTTLALQNVGGLSASIHDQYSYSSSGFVYHTGLEEGSGWGSMGFRMRRDRGPFAAQEPPSLQAAKRMRQAVDDITRRVNDPLRDAAYNINKDEVATTYSNLYEGMVGGGLDPDRIEHHIGGDRDMYNRAVARARLTIPGQILGGKDRDFYQKQFQEEIKNMRAALGKDQSLIDFVTTNIASRYGTAAPEVSKQVAPIFNTLPETANNAADILMRFGPIAAGRYEESLTIPGQQPGIDMNAFRGVYNQYRRDERQLLMAQTQARGVGAASRNALQNQMADLAELPEGRDSLVYKQLGVKRRQAEINTLEERDIDQFQIPLARLGGEEARNRILPFSPGSSYRVDLQTLKINQERLGMYQSQMERLRKSGDLTERDELALTQRIEGIKTDSAGRLADLAEGMVDRLPAFSAGRPSGFHSYDSLQLAQMQLMRVGHPSRYWGALNGRDAAFQDEFARGFAVPGTDRPWSRMSGVDAAHVQDRLPPGAIQRGRDGRVIPTSVEEQTRERARISGGSMNDGKTEIEYRAPALGDKSISGPFEARQATPMSMDQTNQLLAQIAQILLSIKQGSGGNNTTRPTEGNARAAASQTPLRSPTNNGRGNN